MDYMYNFMSEGAITTFVNHIYYTSLDRLKNWISGYTIPDMDVKLMITLNGRIEPDDDDIVMLNRCCFCLVKNNDFQHSTEVLDLTLTATTERNIFVILAHTKTEHVMIRISIEGDGFDLDVAMGTRDHKPLTKETASEDISNVFDILKSCVDEIVKHYAPGGVTDYEEENEE